VCLALFAIDVHPRYKLVFAANRDEFYDRPTEQAGFWNEAPEVLAGRDLRGGGTWMGVTRTGRYCALTNVRDPAAQRSGAPSRGRVVSAYLEGKESPDEYLSSLVHRGGDYNGFNLLAGRGEEVYWYSNRAGEPQKLEPGLYGLSNAVLDTAWPKVVRGKAGLQRLLDEDGGPAVEGLLDLLTDRTPAADEDLPRTGVSLAWERLLSPLFISSPTYGTRSSTVLLIDREDRVTFVERTHDRTFRGDADAAFAFATAESEGLHFS